MADNIERLGVELVTEGQKAFSKGQRQYQESLRKSSKTTKDFTKTSNVLGKEMSGMGRNVTGNIPGFNMLENILGSVSSTALIAATSVAVLAFGIVKLGLRGAEVIGIRDAFESIIKPILGADQSAQDFLTNLRTAAAGTISDLELMRLTNVALAGSTGEMRETFGEALPRLLEIARVQAAATGQSVDFLFQSLVTGIKRGSPLLIDNTGLLVNITEAQAAYAAELGITSAQLTEEQKQIALVNATLAAGEQAIEAAGGLSLTAADKMARAGALMQNSIDNLAVSIEPLLSGILDVVNSFLSGIEQATSVIGPIIGEVLSRLGRGVQIIGSIIGPPIQGIMNMLGQLIQFLFNLTGEFIKGAAAIAGAIATGLMRGANMFIFPAVISIATFIADFLSGFSPPRRGPLSTIDRGAANIAQAWTEGFTGAFSQTPIAEVSRMVDEQLGNIGVLGISAVENRLGRLDMALRPFQEQLKIVSDQFEAMKGFGDAAFRAIDRQIERAQEALATGDAAAAQTITRLNLQKQAMQAQLDAQQELKDNTTIQLGLARIAQQEERTLLEIQKARFGEIEKGTIAVTKATKAARPKVRKGGAGAPTPVAAGGAADVAIGDVVAEELVNPLAGLDAFAGDVAGAFLGEIDPSVMAEFGQNTSLLGEQFDRIAASDPVGGIVGMFSGLVDGLGPALLDPFNDIVGDIIGIFDGSTDIRGTTLVAGIEALPNNIMSWLGQLSPILTTGLLGPFGNVLGDVIGMFGGTTDIRGTTLVAGIEALPNNITGWLSDLPTILIDNLLGPFDEIIDLIILSFTDPDNEEGGIAAGITQFIANIPTLFELLPQMLLEFVTAPFGIMGQSLIDMINPSEDGSIAQKFAHFFTGDGENTLRSILQSGVNLFASIPPAVGRTLQVLGLVIWESFALPIIRAINWVIARLNDFFATITTVTTDLSNILSEIGIDFAPLDIQLRELSVAPPAFLQPAEPRPNPVRLTGGREGGLFGSGALRTHKDEIITAAQPFGVFSQKFVRAMDVMSNSMMGTFNGSQSVMGGSNISNVTNDNRVTNINANMNNGVSAIDIATQLAIQDILG